MMLGRSKALALAGLTLGFIFAGCGGGGGTDPATFPTLMFVNASADTTALDLLLNETELASNFQYLDANADFVRFEYVSESEGAYDVVTQDTGTEEVLDSLNVVFPRDTHTILLSVGLQNFGAENLKRLQNVFIDIERIAPNGNKAKLYVMHAFVRKVGFATPQIIFQNPGDNPQFFTPGIEFGFSTDITVDSGSMSWVAKREDIGGTVIYASITESLNAGGIYLVVISGIEDHANTALQPKITFIELTTD